VEDRQNQVDEEVLGDEIRRDAGEDLQQRKDAFENQADREYPMKIFVVERFAHADRLSQSLPP
jgi:hypothetical protein